MDHTLDYMLHEPNIIQYSAKIGILDMASRKGMTLFVHLFKFLLVLLQNVYQFHYYSRVAFNTPTQSQLVTANHYQIS